MYKAVGLVLLLALSSAHGFWSVCTDRPGAVPPVRVESPFCTATLCTVTRGQLMTADAWVTFVQAHARLDVRVTAYIFGVGVNLPVDPPDDNACNSIYNLNRVFIGCPTVPNQQVIWGLNYDVPTIIPAFSNTRVRFELLENGVVHSCANVQATVI